MFYNNFGADSGNQTRTLTLARLRTITMQYPHCWSGRARSCDIRINSSALYQLSYRPLNLKGLPLLPFLELHQVQDTVQRLQLLPMKLFVELTPILVN